MIHHRLSDTVCILEMESGPVNFLTLELRTALLASLEKADKDPAVAAIVLAGKGRYFNAGMNLKDLEAGTALTAPSLHNDLHDCLANMSKPVIAAIHGGAHGGGLELALGCHYRLATPDAELSLPELSVGMIPGARGTQLLPRAIGQRTAADMILNCRRFRADEAPPGLINQLVTGRLLDAAISFAMTNAETRPLPHLSTNDVTSTEDDLYAVIEPGAPDYPGIEPVIRLLKAAANMPFDQAVTEEFEAFTTLKDSETSRIWRRTFLENLKTKSTTEATSAHT